MLTESEVSRHWARLFQKGIYTSESFEKAELMLEELRPESPLRLRLLNELDELKKIHADRIEA